MSYWTASAILSSTMYAHLRESLESAWRKQDDIQMYRSILKKEFGADKELEIFSEIKAAAECQIQESNLDFISERLYQRAKLVSDRLISPPYKPR